MVRLIIMGYEPGGWGSEAGGRFFAPYPLYCFEFYTMFKKNQPVPSKATAKQPSGGMMGLLWASVWVQAPQRGGRRFEVQTERSPALLQPL